MKLVNYPEIHVALNRAFLANFSDDAPTGEVEGTLMLDAKVRSRIRDEMVAPNLAEGEQAETEMQNLERQFVEWMRACLR